MDKYIDNIQKDAFIEGWKQRRNQDETMKRRPLDEAEIATAEKAFDKWPEKKFDLSVSRKIELEQQLELHWEWLKKENYKEIYKFIVSVLEL